MDSQCFGASCVLLDGSGYHQSGFIANGYDDVRLDHNTVQISFEGSSSTSRHDVAKYTMYHCANLTIQYGFDYFVFQNESNQTLNSSSANVGANAGMLGITKNFVPFQVGVSGGGIFNQFKHNTLVVIKMFKGKKMNHPLAYDAREVMDCMKEKI